MKLLFTALACLISGNVFGQIDSCEVIPDPGPCEAAIETYFFNQDTQQCEQTYWGGCEGVVAFWTMNDCTISCGNTNSINSIFTSEKHLIKQVDALGREVNHTYNQIIFYIYDNGSVEKKFIVQD
tara:strand:- start:206 stop:580 length:375 start_codon:yes stop_codon:yes gene_type:complete